MGYQGLIYFLRPTTVLQIELKKVNLALSWSQQRYSTLCAETVQQKLMTIKKDSVSSKLREWFGKVQFLILAPVSEEHVKGTVKRFRCATTNHGKSEYLFNDRVVPFTKYG